MHIINLCFTNVTFSYSTSQLPIINNLTVTLQKGWTGIFGANGIGKTTFAKLACGILLPDKGTINYTNKNTIGYYCEQETNILPRNCDDFFKDNDNYRGRLCSILEIKDDWIERWKSLSYGERKKLQIAIALWKNPDILALDEPTNHLDEKTSKSIIDTLQTYRGTGLIISHNRFLLDKLCNYCLFININNTVLRKGGISEGLLQEEKEEIQKERQYENSYDNFVKLEKSTIKLNQKLSLKKKSLSKKHLDLKDHDGKARIDGLRLQGKDAKGAKKLKNMQSRTIEAKMETEKVYFKRREIDGFSLKGEKAKCNYFLYIDKNKYKFNNGISISVPDLIIKPDDRIGIEGDNGTGKSTIINHIYNSLSLPSDKILYIPQEVEQDRILKIKNEIYMLNKYDLGKLLTIIYRLGSEPERIINTENPSPGEIRKILLGLGLLKTPMLIIMDEPTNHIDLPSVICLEKALNEFKGALLLVSHDQLFLNKITNIRWEISFKKGERRLIIK
jgi:macrolide transport system ATP-binding/permease protein